MSNMMRIFTVCFSCLLLGLSGCESDRFDHTPPAGQGTLIVDNLTSDTLLVYVDGHGVFDVSDNDHELIDLEPGVCRVVIDEKNGFHSYADYTDILDGQLTVLEVDGYSSANTYSVKVYYD